MSRKNTTCYGLTGGGTGALDSILSTRLTDNGLAITIDTAKVYLHYYDSSSAAAESSPDVIRPDDLGVGDAGRWLLLDVRTGLAALDAIGALTPAANKIPHFTSASAATALEVLEQRVLGRITGGSIAGLTAAQLVTLLGTVTHTNPSQPAFLAQNSATDTDVTGDGTQITVDFDTEIFDQASNFALDTFTAPVAGRYQLNTCVYLLGLAASDVIELAIVTSNRTYIGNSRGFVITNEAFNLSVLADMDAADTALVRLTVTGGTKDVDIYGAASSGNTSFGGFLVC